MKIAVVVGTPVRGVTYHMKEMFLEHLGKENQITEFYPNDFPTFCVGCKNCFLHGEDRCPHADKVQPIWESFLETDLIVFAYPVYALRAPASIKSLLDHLCVHWMVHRPEPDIFKKAAVIITNSVGAPNGSAQKDAKTSLTWLGVSKIHTCGAGMMGDILWDTVSDKSKVMLSRKTTKLMAKCRDIKPRLHRSPKVSLYFAMSKLMHQGVLNSETVPSLDNQFFIDRGWIKKKK